MSKLSKRLFLGVMGVGAATILAACAEPDTTATDSTAPGATAESPAGTYEEPVAGAPATDAAGTETIDQVVANDDSFSTLEAAIQAAGAQDMLSQPGPYTVFAPTNEAFEALPPETLDALLQPENQEQLRQILAYHVVSGEVPSTEITPGEISTSEGQPLNVATEGANVIVGEARVVEPDIVASNGVIHAIDQVLLPPNLQL
ncbi:fasciclin domain-containing protein [Leptolyngbya sp. AN02str]